MEIFGHSLERHYENGEAVSGRQIARIVFGFKLVRRKRFDSGRCSRELRNFLVCLDEYLKSPAENFERYELPISVRLAGGC